MAKRATKLFIACLTDKPVITQFIQKIKTSIKKQPILRILAYETIENYPESSITAYIDGSAVNATRNRGYGGYLVPPYTPDRMSISGPCGEYCNNYDAEIVAI